MSLPSLPPLVGGRYRPLRLLGKGGMGTVYEVEHVHTGQHLALKVLTQQAGASVERFRREARAASQIKSDHIVRVTDADVAPELGGAPFLVMELLEGADLEQATGDRPAAPAEVVEWLRQAARGLGKAHDAGIVHRDLKPENLFLTRREDGTPLVKILDFGIAKLAAEAVALTASDTLLGTPTYMAPEQTDSSGPPVSLRADLYTLGLIAFKLLSGRTYWRSGSLAQLLAQILAEPMVPASERGSTLGAAFDSWFQTACDRDPKKRFASAKEQVEALAAALGLPSELSKPSQPGAAAVVPGSTESMPPSPSLNASFTDLTTLRRRTARRRMFGGGIAAGIVALGIAAAMTRVGRERPQPRLTMDPPGRSTALLPPEPAQTLAPIPSAAVVPNEPPPPAAPAGATSSSAPASASAAGKNRSPAPASSVRSASPADAPKRRDPLESPW